MQFPKLFSLGMATKTGPNKKIMKNSRLSLTLIGYGSTSVKSPTILNSDESNYSKMNFRKTIMKVIFIFNSKQNI